VAAFDRSVLRNPRWILALVVALGLAALFVRLGVWQLDRLQERRASNALIESRAESPARPLDVLISEVGEAPEDLVYRATTVEGTFRQDLEFVSIGRTFGSAVGSLILTPLELEDGRLLVVARGLVPSDEAGPPATTYPPPEGLATVTGRIDDGEEPLRIGEPDPDGGVLTSLSRVDLEYIDRWIPGEVLGISILLDEVSPPEPRGQPVRVPPEELGEGSHLGYAIQWFGFAVIAVVGVGFLVYRAGTREGPAVSETERDSVPIP
jgi:cytochrome oxidase assembly protein ShyY1